LIRFEIPWEDIDKHVHEAVRHISRSARIPGFRPGKAPERLIRSRFAQHIKDQVINHVVPEAYGEVLKENKWDVVSEPSVHDVMYAEGSPFLFQVTIEIRPTLEIKDYTGIKLHRVNVQVKPEEVDMVLKNYQEGAAELIPLDRPAQKGDYLQGKIVASIDGRKIFESQATVDLGALDVHPAFAENLVDHKAGDDVEFDAGYEEDYHEKTLAGKSVHYSIHVDSVNEKRMAALDDEFAKDLGDFASLADLKEKIHKDLLVTKENEQRNHMRDEILKTLVDANPFEVPESMVQTETEALMREYAYALHQRKVNLKDPSIKWDEIHAMLTKQADQNIRSNMIVQAIARQEKIEVTEQDLESGINLIAVQQRRPSEAVKAELAKDNKMPELKNRLLFSKTLDFLLDKASIETV
jgi:trigger factor